MELKTEPLNTLKEKNTKITFNLAPLNSFFSF